MLSTKKTGIIPYSNKLMAGRVKKADMENLSGKQIINSYADNLEDLLLLSFFGSA